MASIAHVRLWRQAGLGLPSKRPRRRLAANRPRPLPPRAANHVWAYDFVFDSCANGQELECLTVVDDACESAGAPTESQFLYALPEPG